MDMKSAFTLTVRPDNVAVVAIDVPDESRIWRSGTGNSQTNP